MLLTLLSLLLGIVVIFVIIAVNGYFVAQEFAYMSVDRIKLKSEAAAGNAEAKRALKVTKRTSFMLSGAQLGITVTGLMVGYVAEPLTGEALGSLLGVTGVPTGVGIAVGTSVALGFATVIQMIFGELYPKNLAIAKPEPIAKKLSRSTLVYLSVFGWLITVFDKAANLFLKLLKITPVHDMDVAATAEDLEHIVSDSYASGDIPEDLYVLIDRILDFGNQDVEHAMVPYSKVDVVQRGSTVGEVIQLMSQGHTRYPVVSEEGEPLGVVQMYDLLSSDFPHDTPIVDVVKPAVILSTFMPLRKAFVLLTESRNELGCVVDEYGGFAGVLTLEDIAEELIGEVVDEHDETVEVAYSLDGKGGWVFVGSVPIDEAERVVNRELPRGDYETLAGLLLFSQGELLEENQVVTITLPPQIVDTEGDVVQEEVLRVEVVKISKNVPSEVRVTLETVNPSMHSTGTNGKGEVGEVPNGEAGGTSEGQVK